MRPTILIIALFVASCANPRPVGELIPPSAPEFDRSPPSPPFVEREAKSVATSIAVQASVWRPPGTVIVAVVADMNPSYGKTNYSRGVRRAARFITEELRPDVVVSAGDMVAGQKRGLDYQAMWQAFDRVFWHPLEAGGYPLFVTPGNHDGSAGSYYAEERTTYRRVWEPRKPDIDFVAGSNWPFYYAFERDGVLFIGIDATTVGPLPATQRDWLARTLADNDDARSKLVFGHVPPRPFAIGREWETLADPEFEEMMAYYKVDVVVTGHHHAYYPGRVGDVHYVGAAALGSGPRPLIGHAEDSPRGITVITFLPDGELHIEARVSPDFDTVIDHAGLPERIDHAGRSLGRQDIEHERARSAP